MSITYLERDNVKQKTLLHRAIRNGTIAASAFALAASLHAQVAVTPANMNGWSFWSLNAAATGPQAGSTGAMVIGPATPPLGTGSAELSTGLGNGDGGVGITTGAYDGDLLSSLSVLSYSAYDAVNNGQQFPYLAINVNLNDGSGGQDTLFFEPPYQTASTGNPSLPDQGATVQNVWQNWNAAEGGWWDNNGVLNPGTGVGSIATYLAAYPDATIADSTAFPLIDGVTLQVGFGSSGETETGYVDDFSIATGGATTTYDFDPSPASAPDETSTIALLLTTALGLAGIHRAQRRTV